MKQNLLSKGKNLQDIGIEERNISPLEKAQVAYDNYLKLLNRWKQHGNN